MLAGEALTGEVDDLGLRVAGACVTESTDIYPMSVQSSWPFSYWSGRYTKHRHTHVQWPWQDFKARGNGWTQ